MSPRRISTPPPGSCVLELMRDEVDRGLSVLWVTQDAAEAAAADRVLSLGDGEPPGADPVAVVAGAPATPLLTLRVSPWDGRSGPAVRTPVALEIPVARTGVTAVEGPNAAGKSVLLAVAAGILRLDQVQVIGGPDPGAPPILSSQYPELEIFEEKAGDEVIYAAVSRGIPRAEAMGRAAAAARSAGARRRGSPGAPHLGALGGEKRLLSLVAGLIAPASLHVLDEPTAGLDARRRRALAGIVGEVGPEHGAAGGQPGRGVAGWARRPPPPAGWVRPPRQRQVPAKKRIDKALSRA